MMPYPVRDMSKSPLPKKPPAVDKNGEIVPGARLELDSDVAEIEFDSGSDQLDDDAIDAVNKLADVLLKNATAHITLVAYADGKTMSPRESRRLSLARALAVRDYLTVKGVPSSRVDVRAMGVNVPSGDPNRIDVKVD